MVLCNSLTLYAGVHKMDFGGVHAGAPTLFSLRGSLQARIKRLGSR